MAKPIAAIDLACLACGSGYQRNGLRREPKYQACSPACRSWLANGHTDARIVGTCARCDAPLNRSNAKYCSLRCAEIFRGARLAEPLPLRNCALEECGVEFQPKTTKQHCCCEKHGKVHSHRMYRAAGKEARQPWDDKRKDAYQKRRALKKATSTGDPVLFEEIAQRDNWTCYLCTKSVDPKVAWPHPLSASQDHVIPLTKGGVHDPSNVRLTHLRCNLRKAARVAEAVISS